MNSWLVWDGKKWSRDTDGLVTRLVAETIRGMYAEAEHIKGDSERDAFLKFIKRALTRRGINAVLGIARDLEGVTISVDSLDADPYFLNVNNGYVDLRTGDLYKHDPDCLMTRLIPHDYEPEAVSPLWNAFLETVLPNTDTRDFVQRWVGYSATGITNERIMVVFYGAGMNGKSTLREVADEILGDHTRVASTELLVGRKDGTIPTDLAGLKGKRSVTASESGKGKPLATALVKQMTGGDTVTARFMRQDFFDFVPTFKITLLTNHKPKVDADDQAIWDRIKMVHFKVRISEASMDRNLRDKLKREYAGILAWIVKGAVNWYKNGLGTAPEVQAATQEYREESDTVSGFLEAGAVLGDKLTVSSSALYSAYKGWVEAEGGEPLSLTRFGEALQAREFDKPERATSGENKGRMVWHGIALPETLQKVQPA